MQVQFNDEEKRQQMELEAFEKIKEEELKEKAVNDKAKRKKADKTFRLIVFGLMFLVIAAVVINYLFAGGSGL